MQADTESNNQPIDVSALFRFAGTAMFVLAAFVGFFHVNIWMSAASGGDSFNALFGAVGVLGICALPPIIVIGALRAWRSGSYGRMERDFLDLKNSLLSRGSNRSTREIVQELIGIHGAAQGTGFFLGLVLSVSLFIVLMLIAAFLQSAVANETFTQNQATLLVLFSLFSTFGFYAFFWPESDGIADRFDPSGVIAQAIGR